VEYEFPPHVRVSRECTDLLKNILVPDPASRYTVEDIQRHPWYLKDLPPGVKEMNDNLPPPAPGLQAGHIVLTCSCVLCSVLLSKSTKCRGMLPCSVLHASALMLAAVAAAADIGLPAVNPIVMQTAEDIARIVRQAQHPPAGPAGWDQDECVACWLRAACCHRTYVWFASVAAAPFLTCAADSGTEP
jgi:hypothetical protein